ncbi:glycosyltransferase family 4 protein [Algoriphagus litoralis]|uniref:glycosyltransferase family 4 protein n=1 Tax=Algoriphagus litoralis TaxID=2202829 RepID=UPI000DBA2080|nr:glycosyltransferase family 4 protein [Algoriphagus litoralis]
MKILYINSLYSPLIEGGAEISLKLIVEGLKSRGHDVVVLSLMPESGLKEEIIDTVKVYRAGLINRYWPYSKSKPGKLSRLGWHVKDRVNTEMGELVKQILAKENPDIVSCHNLAGWSVSVWDVIHASKTPIVQVLHDLYLLCPNSNMFKGQTPCTHQCTTCKLLRFSHSKKSAKVNAVVGISQNILSRFTSAGYFKKAANYVVYNTRAIDEPARKPFRRKNQKLIIGYIGTLSPIKGVEWLIDQFKTLGFSSHLFIAGKGETAYEKRLKKAGDGHSIEFLGYQNSQEFFTKIDVLVVPSLWQEPLGMVAIEALAHHIPVIANKAGGLQETIQDQINGLFCYSDRPESLGEALTTIYLEPETYNSMSQVARKSVEDILSAERMISAYETVLNQTLQKTT